MNFENIFVIIVNILIWGSFGFVLISMVLQIVENKKLVEQQKDDDSGWDEMDNTNF